MIGGLGSVSAYARGAVLDSGEWFTQAAGVQRYWKDLRAGAGLFEADGSPHLSQLSLIGAELGAARLNPLERSNSTQPLVVFLATDAVLEVFRGNELLLSEQYAAGVARIETSSFPRGTYSVDIHVLSDQAQTRTESRLFTSFNPGSDAGKSAYRFQVGATRPSGRLGADQVRSELFVGAGVQRSLANWRLSGRGGILAKIGFSEVAVNRNTLAGQLRLSGLLTSNRNYGLSASAAGAVRDAHLSAQFRHSRSTGSNLLLRRATGVLTEFDLTLNKDLKRLGGQFAASLRWAKRSAANGQVGFGIDWYKILRRWPGERPTLRLGYQHTDGTHRMSVSIRTALRRGRSRVTFEHTERYRSTGPLDLAQREARQNVAINTWSASGAAQRWNAGLNVDRGRGGGRVSANALLERESFSTEGFVRRGLAANDSLFYGGSITSTLAIAPGTVIFNRTQAQSGVLMDLRTSLADSAISAQINRRRRTLPPGRVHFQPLTALRKHSIAFSAGDNLSLGHAGKLLAITPFPGQILRLQPHLYRQITLFGRLEDAALNADSGAYIDTQAGPQPLDEQGYFVVDMPIDTQSLNVQGANGLNCEVALPNFLGAQAKDYLSLGVVGCVQADVLSQKK